jgi:hypothetical protein
MSASPLRWSLTVAMLAALAAPMPLGAQAIGSIGGRPSGGVHRPGGVRPSVPAGPRPRGTITTVPLYPAARGHRPVPFRSSLFGFVYFDPYWWLAPDFGDEGLMPTMAPPGPRPMGGLQLDVEPRRAFVYVDGFFVGTVDQYKGYFQHLDTTAGYHFIEFLAPDYDPLVTGVTVVPNQTTTYRGFLNRASGR